MTNQELFDKVKNHLLSQNAQSIAYRTPQTYHVVKYCVYKNENGLKCAIGCLIPDEKYSPEFEGVSLHMRTSGVPSLRMHAERIIDAAGLNKENLDLAEE